MKPTNHDADDIEAALDMVRHLLHWHLPTTLCGARYVTRGLLAGTPVCPRCWKIREDILNEAHKS